MAKSIARFLVAVMAVAAMALASAGGTGLAQAQTNTPTDRAALVVLHNATDGPNWNINTNWLSDRPIGEWHGVTTNSNGRVIKLDLFSNQLTGEIPPELGGLTSLQVLHLWGNELTGTIPVELGNLTSLTILALGDNELTGPIPTELGSLTSLQVLGLWGNELTGTIPVELGNLTSLTILNLYANQLTGEIPPELGSLTSLQELALSDNELTGPIPTELGSLTSLQVLHLWGNELTGTIPVELGNLTSLTILALSANQLTGEIPPELGSLTSLQELALSDNELTGPIPTELGSLTSLQVLHLWGNELTGTIPVELGNLTSLTILALSANQLTGEIPPELGGLTSLQELALGDNELTGPIPTELGSLTSLQVLHLWGNELTGTIPVELGNLTSLAILNLSANQLTGEIPPELGSLTSLTILNLYANQLTGEIPPELGSLTSLTILNLYANQLTGEIPPELGSLTSLTILNLYANQLTGEIPPELGGLTSLQELALGDNELTGPIPTELGSLTSLQVLGLWGTELTGTIPVELGNLTSLTILALSDNELTGPIPTELGSLTSLTILALGDNELTGPIPTELGSLTSLQVLDLWGNELTGTIPVELGNLTSLAILNLSANQLTGEIPAELGRLDKLEELHLSENLLTGCIPGRLQDVLTNDLAELGLPFCGDSLVDRYDTNGNKMIDKNEVIAAINDYLFGEGDEAISKAEVIRLINLYLFAPPTPHNPPHVILRVVQVTEDWVPFSSAGGWTQAVLQKESDVLRYYEAAIWEETDSVHLYAFPNDYDGLFGLRENVPDADVIAYREQHAISVHSDMPEMWGDRRSDFLRIAFEDFVSRLVELHPEADHHLMYSGHGGPGGNLFAGQLKHDDAGAFLATWTRLLGKPLGVIDMGGPCNKGGYEDLANFCRHASYYVASDLPNGGYALDDWTWEKHHETEPETQYHRLLASNETLEEALIERVELRRKRYEYSMNNQIRDQVEQANYVYSCARFNDFSEAFELFVGVTTIQTPVYDLYQLMLDYSAPPALLDRFRDVFVHGVDNRDFFEWKVTANGMISPSGAPTPTPPHLVVKLLEVRDHYPEKYDALVALSWIQDGVSASESYAVSALASAAFKTDIVFSALLGKPWIRDGLTEEEAETIEIASNLGILEMPFMDVFEIQDYTAARFLGILSVEWDGRYLQQVLNHPSFSGGITDMDTVILTALSGIARYSWKNQEIVESLLILLDPDERYQQERTIALPLAGETTLTVIRSTPGTFRTMDILEEILRQHEGFMNVPYPFNVAVIINVHSEGPRASAGGYGLTTLEPGYEEDFRLLAHEVAHSYWRIPRTWSHEAWLRGRFLTPFNWIAEGAATFTEAIATGRIDPAPASPSDIGCTLVNTIGELDQGTYDGSLEGKNLYGSGCNYTMGYGLFANLYSRLGNTEFRRGFGSLYLKISNLEHEDECTGAEKGLCYVRKAFVEDAYPGFAEAAGKVIDRWYYGSSESDTTSN